MIKLDNYKELPSTSGIYFIINIINNKYYLGRASNFKTRYSYIDLEITHHNEHLRRALLKYGRENFIIKIIEYPNIFLEELIDIEQKLLDEHYGNPLCYNISPLANGGSIAGENHPVYGKITINNGIRKKYISPDKEIPEGYIIGGLPRTEEQKQKQSEAMSGENNPNYRKVFSYETKQKLSEANKGKIKINNGTVEKLISPGEEIPEGFILGAKPMSEEHHQKLKKARNCINYKHNIRVISHLCCYFSVKDAMDGLGISKWMLKKQFEKDPQTGFYVEKKSRSLIN